MTTASSTYALRLSDDELGRYRMMAARARAEEGDLWALAGIVPGARVADVGCGPGAMLVTLAEVVGSTGQVVGVDADPAAVAAARAAQAPRRKEGCFTDRCGCAFARHYAAPFPEGVPLTSIYSRGDGVVWWEACTVPYARNVEVSGSHIGLAFNRKAYRVIADALVA